MKRAAIAISFCLALTLFVPGSASAGSGFRFFHTADGNISCVVAKRKKARRKHHKKIPGHPGGARCDVAQHTWTAPPRPKWCDVDWGFGVEVGDRSFGRFVCAGDGVASPQTPVLAEGGVLSLGTYTCSVLAGPTMACKNNVTGHGFGVSAAQVALF
jgi:Family of unknown function (DUF6636)